MFRLFRKIRKNLLERNDLLKYLYYVIGEISLVVLGILIAFQIDNWKKEELINNRMNQIYKSLKKELREDLDRAIMIDSVYTTRRKQVKEIVRNGISREEFLEQPNFYFNLPLRSHTLGISTKAYNNLILNIDNVPPELDTLVILLNKIHVNVSKMNTKYDQSLNDFTFRVMEDWSKSHEWYYQMRNKQEPSEEAIDYFINDWRYLNLLEEYKDYLYNANIACRNLKELNPICIQLIVDFENKRKQ